MRGLNGRSLLLILGGVLGGVLAEGCNLLGIPMPQLEADGPSGSVDAGAADAGTFADAADDVDASPSIFVSITDRHLREEDGTAETSKQFGDQIGGVVGSGASRMKFPGNPIGNGSRVQIDGIAPGTPYVLEAPSTLARYTAIVDPSRTVDIGKDLAGRLLTTVGGSVMLDVSVGGMRPWTPNDRIEVSILNLGTFFGLNMIPAAGATSYVDALDFGPLGVSTAKGDVLRVGRLRAADGGSIFVLDEVATLSPFEAVAGKNTLNGTFVTTGTRGSVSVELHRPMFAQLENSMLLVGTMQQRSWDLLVTPAPPFRTIGVTARQLELVHLVNAPLDGATDNVTRTGMSFLDPYPQALARVVIVRHVLTASPQCDTKTLEVASELWVAPAASGTTLLEPRIGPVLDLRVNGMAATSPQTLTGDTLLTWSRPAVGTADRYLVVAKYVDTDPISDAAVIIVPGDLQPPAATFPFSAFLPSRRYVFVVTAISTAGNVRLAPFRVGLPFGSSQVLTNCFVTPTG